MAKQEGYHNHQNKNEKLYNFNEIIKTQRLFLEKTKL